MSEVFIDTEDFEPAVPQIGQSWRVNCPTSRHHQKIAKIIDKSKSFNTVEIAPKDTGWFRNEELEPIIKGGYILGSPNKYSWFKNKIPLERGETITAGADLLDAPSSHDKEEDELLSIASEDRKKEYKRTARMQKETLEVAEKISSLMDKHHREKEELEAWKNGEWFEKYWEPDYKKIGLTVAAQAVNLIQLGICCASGPFGVLISVPVFLGGLWINYLILDNLSKK